MEKILLGFIGMTAVSGLLFGARLGLALGLAELSSFMLLLLLGIDGQDFGFFLVLFVNLCGLLTWITWRELRSLTGQAACLGFFAGFVLAFFLSWHLRGYFDLPEGYARSVCSLALLAILTGAFYQLFARFGRDRLAGKLQYRAFGRVSPKRSFPLRLGLAVMLGAVLAVLFYFL